MDAQVFIVTVLDQMRDLAGSGVSNEGDQFAIWFLTRILLEPLSESIETYHIGSSGDNKLDIGIDDDNHDVIIIGQSKFSHNPLSTTYNASLVEDALNAQSRLVTVPNIGSQRRKDFAEQYSASKDSKPVRLIAVGFGKFSPDAYEFAIANAVEIYDFDKLKERYQYNEVAGTPREPQAITLMMSGGQLITRKIASHFAEQWIFLGRAIDIYKAVRKHQDGLFTENLRYKLDQSAKSGISKDIRETVIKEADALTIFNNGLTVVASKVNQVGDQLTLTQPQIVNGCQTSWAIHDAFEELKKAGHDIDANETEILIKLIEVQNNPPLITKITQTTNKQNAIRARDVHANDKWQHELGHSFYLFKPHVFYEQKDGSWQSTLRQKKQSAFKAAGSVYRKLSNIEAAQLYLAVLGFPYWSKQNKGKIFEDPYYRAIFRVDLSNIERFESLDIDLKALQVETGADGFRNDVMFAFGISKLSDAIKMLYERKLKSYGDEAAIATLSDDDATAFRILNEDYRFLRVWEYLVVALFCHIVRKWVNPNNTVEDLRYRLLDNSWDVMFGPVAKRLTKFILEPNKRYAIVLHDDTPSTDFKIFSTWYVNLAKEMSRRIRAEREKAPAAFRLTGYIDQRAETFREMRSWINQQYAEGPSHWRKLFPLG